MVAGAGARPSATPEPRVTSLRRARGMVSRHLAPQYMGRCLVELRVRVNGLHYVAAADLRSAWGKPRTGILRQVHPE